MLKLPKEWNQIFSNKWIDWGSAGTWQRLSTGKPCILHWTAGLVLFSPCEIYACLCVIMCSWRHQELPREVILTGIYYLCHGGFAFSSVCVCACHWDCKHSSSKSFERILVKLCKIIECGDINNPFNFGICPTTFSRST